MRKLQGVHRERWPFSDLLFVQRSIEWTRFSESIVMVVRDCREISWLNILYEIPPWIEFYWKNLGVGETSSSLHILWSQKRLIDVSSMFFWMKSSLEPAVHQNSTVERRYNTFFVGFRFIWKKFSLFEIRLYRMQISCYYRTSKNPGARQISRSCQRERMDFHGRQGDEVAQSFLSIFGWLEIIRSLWV